MKTDNEPRWKRSYSFMLLANLAYIILFYFLMQIYN